LSVANHLRDVLSRPELRKPFSSFHTPFSFAAGARRGLLEKVQNLLEEIRKGCNRNARQ
jgi:hypothetical protein